MSALSTHTALPFELWPDQDRIAWNEGLLAEISDTRCAIRYWAASTRASVQGAYGRWLYWVAECDRPALARAPKSRFTPDRFRRYLEYLSGRLKPISVATAVRNLRLALRVVALPPDIPWLEELASRFDRSLRLSSRKNGRYVPTQDLRDLGAEMMEGGRTSLNVRKAASLYRDGLMIALLALRPLRLANFLGLELDKSLVRRGNRYWIQLVGKETKNKAHVELPFPPELLPNLRYYLRHERPVLLGASPDPKARNLLWLSRAGGKVSRNAFYTMTKLRTLKRFGRKVTPHLFRDCLATTLSATSASWTIPLLLGHRSSRTWTVSYDIDLREIRRRRFEEHLESLRSRLSSRHPVVRPKTSATGALIPPSGTIRFRGKH